jgi:hypothetical protein
MSPYTTIQAAEGLALSKRLRHEPTETNAEIGGHVVTVRVTGAMVNRGYATHEANRFHYMLDGRRISRSMLLERLSG